ncbi:MAG: rRNA maturation RNase YbeY [Myxococcales bacterium]|nr:rRNA maturation RNase YbeY [Myxococcales bacterium]
MLTAAARTERRQTLEASLRLTDDPTIRELNRDFRHKDKPTDVLAFAQREGPWAGVGAELLGDIVISVPTARRQAKRKSPEGVYLEVRFLAAHGLCHLLGYDHRDDEEERVMNARMTALLAQASGSGRVHAA